MFFFSGLFLFVLSSSRKRTILLPVPSRLVLPVEKNDCSGNESEFVVDLYTDPAGNEESWVLEKLDGDTGVWEEVFRNTLDACYCNLYVNRLCLEPSETYRWTYYHSGGDGCRLAILCTYTVTLNGGILLEDSPFGYEISVSFVTPADPDTGETVFLSESPSGSPTGTPTAFGCTDLKGYVPVDDTDGNPVDITCRGIRRKIRQSGRGDTGGVWACNRSLTDGSGGIVADRCRDLCSPYGVGPCAP